MTRKETKLDGKGKYYAFLALGVLSMSSAAPLVKIASADTGPLSMAFWRLLIASIIIIPFGAHRGGCFVTKKPCSGQYCLGFS